MFDRILVVCVGNICRSPLAEHLLRRGLPHLDVSSAGIGALVDKPADEMASTVALTHGINLEGHYARQLSKELIDQSDLVLVLEPGHKREVTAKYPHASGRVMLLDQWVGAKGIPDPYQRSQEFHEHVYELIDQATNSWIEKLAGGKGAGK